MYPHATLYLARPLDLAGIADALAGQVEVVVGPDRFCELRADGVAVVMRAMPVAEIGLHLDGLRGYLRARCAVAGPYVWRRVDDVRQVLGLVIEPGFRHGDRVWRWLTVLARAGAGLVFLAGAFLDDRGQPLAAPPGLELATTGDDEGAVRAPPDAARVLHRARALAAVVERAALEAAPADDGTPRLARLRGWTELSGIRTELEADERALVDAPLGAAHERQLIDATWRGEGLAVLAWALGLAALPAHDEPCPVEVVLAAVGYLADAPPAHLRPADELERARRRHLALHWRLRQHRLAPGAVDLVKLSQAGFLGGFDLFGVALAERDLAIGGQPMHRADPDRIRAVASSALERHHASNWLRGDHPIYSAVTTPT